MQTEVKNLTNICQKSCSILPGGIGDASLARKLKSELEIPRNQIITSPGRKLSTTGGKPLIKKSFMKASIYHISRSFFIKFKSPSTSSVTEISRDETLNHGRDGARSFIKRKTQAGCEEI